jgi:hypothetical protein
MKKPRVTLSDIIQPAPPPVTPPVEPAPIRPARTHTTLYVPKRVLREIRAIANDFDRKPHDLLIEGVDLMLAKYGRKSVAKLSAE